MNETSFASFYQDKTLSSRAESEEEYKDEMNNVSFLYLSFSF